MLTGFPIVCGCLCATAAKLSSCNRNSMACRAYNSYCLAFCKKEKSLLTPALDYNISLEEQTELGLVPKEDVSGWRDQE